MSTDNYSNYSPDEVPELNCRKCGTHLEDLFVAFEDTEYEREIEVCEECFFNAEFEAQII